MLTSEIAAKIVRLNFTVRSPDLVLVVNPNCRDNSYMYSERMYQSMHNILQPHVTLLNLNWAYWLIHSSVVSATHSQFRANELQ